MSDEPKFDSHRSCRWKKRYPSEDTAQLVANKVHIEHGVRLVPYLCLECGGHHLTSHTRQHPKAGWREPRMSQRQQAEQRKYEDRRYGRSRR